MKGRTPTPTAIKALLGNPGHRPLDSMSEPAVVIGLGEPPARLQADIEAVRCWMSLGPELVKLKTLAETDRDLFAAYCQAVSRAAWLTRRIMELRGRKTLRAADELRLGTYESQLGKTNDRVQKIGAEFGIGAASRTRIKVRPDDGQGELPLGESTPFGLAAALAQRQGAA